MSEMSKPIAVIVESVHEARFALVRAKYAALREAGVQVERTEKRALDARRIADAAVAKLEDVKRELGLALLEARQAWPERGPKAKGWGEFLDREGISQSTAWRLMEEAKGFHSVNEMPDAPHAAERGEAIGEGPIPLSGRKPLGLLADMQLLLGRWEDVLSKDEIGVVDAIITDAPYSAKTHAAATTRADGIDADGLTPDYTAWGEVEIDAFVASWAPRCRGWMVVLSDDVLIPIWRAAYERYGRYAFAPVPCVINGMSVRMQGDGPSSWAVYAMVSRPRELAKWGTLPGAYTGGREDGAKGGRGKPRWLIDALVQDYTRENDLVCDPLAGYGTTLVSALLQRRRAIGAEMDEAAVNEAFARADALNQSAA